MSGKYSVELEARLVDEVKALIKEKLDAGGVDSVYDSLTEIGCCNRLCDMWSKLSEEKCYKLLRYDASIIKLIYSNYQEASVRINPELSDFNKYLASPYFESCIDAIEFACSKDDMRSKPQQVLEDKLLIELAKITDAYRENGELKDFEIRVGYLSEIAESMACYVSPEQATKLLHKENILQNVLDDWLESETFVIDDYFYCGDFTNFINKFIDHPDTQKESLADKLTGAGKEMAAQEESKGIKYQLER